MPQPIRNTEPTQKGPPSVASAASAYIFYTIFTVDAPSSDFSTSQVVSAARNFLSSSAAASSVDFFALDGDSPIPEAIFLAFIIVSHTGQSFEIIRKCLRLGPAQDVHFFLTRSHLSALKSRALIFSTNFQFIFTFK